MKNLNSFKDFKENLKKTGFRYAFLLLLSLIIPQWTTAQLFPVAGNCTTGLGTNVYAPASSSTALSTSRHAVIYPASQLTGIVGQTLTSIYLNKITATDLGGTPNLKIYLATTTSTDFGSTSPDWATLITGATKVYDNNPATATAGAVGPKQLVFSANFVYPTSTNLMVMFEYVNTGNTTNVTWEYEYTSPCVSTANNNTTKYVNTVDGTLAAVLNSSNYRRPRIGFDYLVSCPAPTALTVNNITTNSATASWTIGGTETSWDFAVVAGGSGIPTSPSVVTANTQNISSLTPNTSYDLYVRAKCGGTNGDSV
ncbi:MAG: fibronectin type III domain-containing protein, partial [Bacteroidetes bacterium]|nr:fibronectin type III domain-containing protein [Bacteroidota bacterium]